MKILFLLIGSIALTACTPDNEHFCAKYSYYFDELSAPGILPYKDIKQQLEKEIKKSNRDKDRLMLMVLEDKHNDVFGYGESAAQYCMQSERWKKF
jgi:hypothetical protein